MSHAALYTGELALLLARIGSRQEAAEALRLAARDAEAGGSDSDQSFAVTCRLLAGFIADEPLRIEDLEAGLAETASIWRDPNLEELRPKILDSFQNARERGVLSGPWAALCRRYLAPRSAEEARGLLNVVGVTALVGRFMEQTGETELALRLYEVVAQSRGGNSNAIFPAVFEAQCELLLSDRCFEEALATSLDALALVTPAHERVIFWQFAARSLLALGRLQEVFEQAASALKDWTRVLDGLYVDEHKIGWLELGEPILRCAIAAISRPVGWMAERDRRRQLFRLTELGKARILTDMVASSRYDLGAFSLADSADAGAQARRSSYAMRDPDWYLAQMIQAGVAHADVLMVYDHDGIGGYDKRSLSTAPLRVAIRLPVSPGRRLVASAASLAFDQSDAPFDGSFYQWLLSAMQKGDVADFRSYLGPGDLFLSYWLDRDLIVFAGDRDEMHYTETFDAAGLREQAAQSKRASAGKTTTPVS